MTTKSDGISNLYVQMASDQRVPLTERQMRFFTDAGQEITGVRSAIFGHSNLPYDGVIKVTLELDVRVVHIRDPTEIPSN